MRPLAAGHEGRWQEWGCQGIGGGHHPAQPFCSHPTCQPSHSPFPGLHPNPAWAPCHCESLPQKDEHQQEDEEAGGEEQLGWEKGGKGGSDRVAEEPKYLPWSPSFSPKIFRLSLPMPSVAYWPQ